MSTTRDELVLEKGCSMVNNNSQDGVACGNVGDEGFMANRFSRASVHGGQCLKGAAPSCRPKSMLRLSSFATPRITSHRSASALAL